MCPPLTPIDDALGAHTDGSGRDHEFAVLIAILRDGLSELELSGAAALFLPASARPAFNREPVARTQVTVVLEVLLGVKATAPASSATA